MPEHSTANSFLGLTARWTAAARAAETRQAEPLFRDPWAAGLAGPEGESWLQSRGGNVTPMVVRTRFFDDFVQKTMQAEPIRQVVIVAAGLDTRAYRLAWPAGTRLFELDQPAVLQYKEKVLENGGAQPACERRAVAVDLSAEWKPALLEKGFAAGQPTLWLLEGFLFYLPDESIAGMLAAVDSLSAPGSVMGFDCVNHVTLTSPITHAWIEMQAREGAPWLGGLDDPEGYLAGLGWSATLSQPGAPDANYGRWTLPVIPLKMPNMPHNWYVMAKKG